MDAACDHAGQALALSQSAGDEQTPFDRATTLAAAAKAFNSAGRSQQALQLILTSLTEADKLDAEDRALFDGLFGEG